MPDIDNFTKSKMDINLFTFRDNLPNDRVKILFNEAMNGNKFVSSSKLQHYNFTENHGGVKTIEFQYDVSALVNMVPVYGTIAWLYWRVVTPNPMAYLYFDSSTGEMLSKSEAQSRREKNKSSENHFKAGKKFESEEKYQQAYEEYEKAFKECSRNYVNENKFLQHRDRAKVEADSDAKISQSINAAHDFLNDGELEATRHEIRSIHSITKSDHNRTKFNSLIDEFNKEINIRKIKQDGDAAFNEGNYAKASECYQKALLTSNIAKIKETYKNLLNSSQNEINVLNIQQKAKTAFQSKNYEQAIVLLKSAINQSNHELNRQRMREELNHVQQQFTEHQKNESAETHFARGRTFESEGKYQQAYEEYENAYQECSRNYINENKFLQHRNRAKDEADFEKAKNEIEVDKMAEDAKSAVQSRNYQRAIDLLKSAFDKTKHELNRQRMREELNHVKQEFTDHQKNEAAENHFTKGKAFEIRGLYQRAYEEYTKAYQGCTKNYKNERKFLEHCDLAKDEIDADKLRKEGERKLTQGDLTSALNQFEAALDITKVNEYQINNKIEFVKNEISAETTKTQGDDFFVRGKYGRALEKYSTAFQMSQDQNLKSTYKALIKNSEDELRAIDDLQKGNAAFKDGNYEEAKNCFSNAHSLTKSETTKKESKKLLDLANTEIEAMKNYQNAQKLLNANYYEKAAVLLKSAVFKTKDSVNQRKLKTELDSVQNEIDIRETVLKAVQLFDRQKYTEAAKVYDEARNKVTQEERQEKLAILQQRCINEAKAQKLAKEGDELYKQSKLLQALEKYQRALVISNDKTEKYTYATLVIKVQEEANQDLIKSADETFNEFHEETNVVIDKVYQLISGLKNCHAINEISTFKETLRKHFDSCIHQLDSIQTNSNDVKQNQQNDEDETPKKELLDLIKYQIKGGSVSELEEAGEDILKLLRKSSDKTFFKLKSLLVGFDKTGDKNEVSTLKQKLHDQFQTYLGQINSIQNLVMNNQPDLTSHYVAKAYEQAEKQQETVRMINYQ